MVLRPACKHACSSELKKSRKHAGDPGCTRHAYAKDQNEDTDTYRLFFVIVHADFTGRVWLNNSASAANNISCPHAMLPPQRLEGPPPRHTITP